MSKLEAQGSEKLPSQTVMNPRENASAILLLSGKEVANKKEARSKRANIYYPIKNKKKPAVKHKLSLKKKKIQTVFMFCLFFSINSILLFLSSNKYIITNFYTLKFNL